MKTFIYFIITSFIATDAMFAGLNEHHELLGYSIGFALWAWFFWGWNKRASSRRRF